MQINIVGRTILLLLLIFLVNACAPGKTKLESKPVQDKQSLSGTAWWVEDINGEGVIDRSRSTLEFSHDNGVAGDTGCNRYFGSVEIAAENIKFSPLAGTRKACVAALMDQEANFYKAIDRVVSWEIAETGLLHLRDAQGVSRIRAFKIEP